MNDTIYKIQNTQGHAIMNDSIYKMQNTQNDTHNEAQDFNYTDSLQSK